MQKLFLIFMLFTSVQNVVGQTVQSTTTPRTIFDLPASDNKNNWMVGTDVRSFGVSDLDNDFIGLKVFYRVDEKIAPYLFWNRFSRNDGDQQRRDWESSGIGVKYSFFGTFSSSPFIRVQSQNVESEHHPYRDRIAITSYGGGYSFVLGRLSVVANLLINAGGYEENDRTPKPPYEFTPLASVYSLELGFFF